MITTHRLGRLAGFGALSTIFLLAACEQSEDATGIQPPNVGFNDALEMQVEAGSVWVCQTVQAGSTTDTGYYELDVDGAVTPFDITGTAPWPATYPDGPDIPGPGCLELENVTGDAMRVTVLNATGFASTGNRVANSTTTWFFGGAQSNPAIDPDNPGSTVWFKPLLEEVPDEDFEGCTPGYWRQEHHYDSWVGYSPTELFSDVFGVGPAIELGEAVEARGGGENALMRHAVAALLNSTSDVNYPYSTADVISMVQDAFNGVTDVEETKDMFAEANELGCPLN